MSTFKDMVNNMTEQVSVNDSNLEEDKQKIQTLWNRFLKEIIDIGYVPKPNEVLNVRSLEGSKHDVSSRVSLETPSKRELKSNYGVTNF